MERNHTMRKQVYEQREIDFGEMIDEDNHNILILSLALCSSN